MDTFVNPFANYDPDPATTPATPVPTPASPKETAGPQEKDDPANPFADYANEKEETDTLKDAQPLSPLDAFATSLEQNFKEGFAGLTGQATKASHELTAKATIKAGREKGVVGPGEAPSSEKPTGTEYDTALGDLAVMEAKRTRWDAFHSEGLAGYTGAFLGSLAGQLFDPVNLIPGVIGAKAIAAIGSGIKATGIISQIALRAGEFGLFTGATDTASQTLDIMTGHQVGFDYQRLMMSTALGAGLGGSFAGSAMLIKGLRGELPSQLAMQEEMGRTWQRMNAELAGGVEPKLTPTAGEAPAPAAPPSNSIRDASVYGPGPAHSFDDAMAIERKGAETEASEARKQGFEVPDAMPGQRESEARMAAFRKEAGPDIETLRGYGFDANAMNDVARLYKREAGEHPQWALERAVGEYEKGLIEEIEKIPTLSPQARADAEEFVRAHDADVARGSPAGGQSTQLAARRSVGEGVMGESPRFEVGEHPEQEIPFGHPIEPTTPGVAPESRSTEAPAAREATAGGGEGAGSGGQAGGERATTEAGGRTEGGGAEGNRGERVVDLTRRIAERERQKAGTTGREVPESNDDLLRNLSFDDIKNYGDEDLDALHAYIETGALGTPKETAVLYDNIQRELDMRGRGAMQDRVANDSERTAQGEQTLVPGVKPITEAERARAGTEKPIEGGNAPMPAGGLFDEDSRKQGNLLLSEGLTDEDRIQPLRGRARTPRGPSAETRRMSVRAPLPGEAASAAGPRLPVSDEEARGLKLVDTMKRIAESLGFRFEVDGRMGVSGALGVYKPKEGVLRAKFAGDKETFSHELGHAIDGQLNSDPRTTREWRALRFDPFINPELVKLDYNSTVTGAPPTIQEGVAEFLRMYINNPAYAQAQAPLATAAFRSNILPKHPEIAGALEEAARMSQIESGLAPTQVFTTMIADPKVSGLEGFSRSLSRYGIVPTFRDYAARAYGAIIRENVHFDRFTQVLKDAGFRKEGKPIPDMSFAADPNHLYRQMDGARQSAVSILDRGVLLDLDDPVNGARSPSINGALARAFNGSFSRIENPTDPLVRAFDGYLVARRALSEWDLFEAGELRNQPIRASKRENEQAIVDFEKDNPQFKAAADDFFEFQRQYLQRRVDKGLLKQETADAFLAKRQDHIPLYRDFGDDKAGAVGGTKGGGLQFNDVHAFMGSTRDVVSPIRSVMQDVARRERRIAENEVYVALDDLARRAGEFAGPVWEHVPNTEIKGTTVDVEQAMRALGKKNGLSAAEIDMMIADLPSTIGEDMTATIFKREPTTPRGERVMFFYRGGERQAVKVGDNEISKHFFDLMTGFSEPEKDIFLKGVHSLNTGFQAAITHAPRFLFGTLVRDNVTRMFLPRNQGSAGRLPFVQDITGIYTMMFDRSFYRAYQETGGIRGGAYSHASGELGHDPFKAAASASGFVGRTMDEVSAAPDFASKAAAISTVPARMVQSVAGYGESLVNRVRYQEGTPAQAMAVLTTPLKMASDALKVMELGETASRLGNAKLTFRYLKSQGLSDVEAMQGAAYESRDVLNYSSHGSMMTGAARLFPFLQAAITGADRSARGLVAEPIAAAMRARERGGYANLDAKDKAILGAAWKNWTMMSAVMGTGAAIYVPYTQSGAGNEFYDRASQYMRDTYWLIQTGHDANGNPVGLTIHKGYDVSAAMMNVVEDFSREVRGHDPISWGKVMGALKEAVPRQFRSSDALLEAAPVIRTAYEVKTGMKLGMEGAPARPLVPDSLNGLPPEQQSTAMTSGFAKFVGEHMGVSPIVVDHVIGSSGTGAQDIRDVSSAIFDNNPLVTTGDAMNRFFFGQVYRTARTDVASGQDLRDVMARHSGEYQTQATAYKTALEHNENGVADSIYNRSDESAKTLMTLQSSSRFAPEDRQLHPLIHAQTVATSVSSMMRDLGKNQILIRETSHRKGEPRKVIELSDEQSRQVHAQLNGILSEETRNGLAIAGHPGYGDFNIINTQPRVEILRQISPEVAKEFEHRMKLDHVLPAQGIADQWQAAKDRLLASQRAAHLRDLSVQAKARGP